MKLFKILLLCLISVGLSFADQQNQQSNSSMKVVAYYPTFAFCDLIPQKIDWKAITHLIWFTSEPSYTYPYMRELVNSPLGLSDSAILETGGSSLTGTWRGWCYNPASNNNTNGLTHLSIARDSAYANGVKLILCLGGEVGTNATIMSWIVADTVRQDIYINHAFEYMKRKGFHGVDINWEYPPTSQKALTERFLIKWREKLNTMNPPGWLSHTAPAWYSDWVNRFSPAVANATLDGFILMAYGMGASNYSGFNAPLARPSVTTYPNYNAWTLDNYGPKQMKQVGYDSAKIVMLIPFETAEWTGVDGPGQLRSGLPSFGGYSTVLTKMAQFPSSMHWDNESKVPWLGYTEGGVKRFISYEDSLSISQKVQFAKQHGLGAVGVWELWRGWVNSNPPGKQDPLLQYLKVAVGRTTTSLPPTIPSVPNLLLPDNLANAVIVTPTLQWTNSAGVNTYHLQVSASSSFSSNVVDDSLLTVNIKQLAPLAYRSTYFWRVRARNNIGYSNWSSVWSFKTDSLLTPILDNIIYDDALKSPWMNASWSSTVDFSNTERVANGLFSIKTTQTGWGALRFRSGTWSVPIPVSLSQNQKLQFKVFIPSGSLSLRISFSNDATQSFPARMISPTTGNWVLVSIPTDSLNPNNQVVHFVEIQNYTSNAVTYYVDALGISGTSTPVDTLPKPTLVSPVNNSINQLTELSLRWSSIQNAIVYHLQVAKDSMFNVKIVDDSLVSASTYPLSGLSENTNYFWRVRAKSNTAIGPYSDISKFTTIKLYFQVSIDKKSIDFGKVVIGKSKLDSIVVQNIGNISANISRVFIISTEFSITPSNLVLQPGTQRKVYITYSPTRRVTVNSKGILLSEDLIYSDTVAVTGRGVSAPKIAFNTASMLLPNFSSGTTIVDSFKVYNIGEVEANITNVQSTNASFLVNPTTATIAEMDSLYFYVVVTSGGNDNSDGYIILISDATNGTDSMYVSFQSALGVGLVELPTEFALKQNYPNPFNPNTIISYTIAEPNHVKLVVHDILGREVKILVNEYQTAGLKTVNFDAGSDAGGLPSGVYFYKLIAGSYTSVKKMLLVR